MSITFTTNNQRKGAIPRTVTISDEDKDLIHSKITVYGNGYAYDRTSKDLLHRIIMRRILGRDFLPGEETDHINLVRTDNRRENLRVVTSSQNKINRGLQSNNQYGYKGIRWNKRLKVWSAHIKINGKTQYLGNYGSAENCAIVYNHKAKELFGEFAVFNDIPGWEEIHPLKIPDMPRWNKRNKSGYRGVCWHKKQEKWVVMITKDNVDYNLGSFDDKHEAARVYNAKAVELYGANAYQNEVME